MVTPQNGDGLAAYAEEGSARRELRSRPQHFCEHRSGGAFGAYVSREPFDVSEYASRAIFEALPIFGTQSIFTEHIAGQLRKPRDRAATLHGLSQELRVVLSQPVAQDARKLIVTIDQPSAVHVQRLPLFCRRFSEALPHELPPFIVLPLAAMLPCVLAGGGGIVAFTLLGH
jgi:hypothetical protein